jgi:tetratricopeptide (TPR) repeat protein
MRLLWAVAVLAMTVGLAHADSRDVAREAFQEGTRQFDIGNIKAALDAFKKAYLNFEDPAILFNIAQCERQLGDKAEALRTYKIYLRKVAASSQRAQVEKIVADLQAAIDQEKAAASRAPTGTLTPEAIAPAPTPAPPPSAPQPESSVPPSPATETAASTPAVASAPHADKPVTKKAWFWGVVAGGAVVVAGAITLGVVLGSRHNPVELYY